MSLIPPNNNTQLIINDFILYATAHLATVSGIINTTSLYPGPGTPVPGPGVIVWTGYSVLPASPPIPKLDTTPIQMNEKQLTKSVLGSVNGLPISEATSLAFDDDLVLGDYPNITLSEAEDIFYSSLRTEPIRSISNEELDEEIEMMSSNQEETNNTQPPAEVDDTQIEEDPEEELTAEEIAEFERLSKELNQDPPIERVPNYNTTIKVPDNVILAMRRWGVGVDNPLERAHFLSQCAHESISFTAKTENLNYSASQLLKVFSKYFKTQALADSYARQPEKIGSYVYGNRMGNGNEESKEGYRYRGRGYIQLTGKANYTKCDTVLKAGIVDNPDLVASNYPGDSACFFWTSNKLKNLCKDASDESVIALTARINGGDNGIVDRKKKFLVYWNELQKDATLWS